MNLQPYLIDVAHQSHETGEPMMRPLPLVYPKDLRALAVDDQYLFGPDLLVAPIHATGTKRDVYLPAGTWYDVFANFKKVEGARRLSQSATLAQMPVFARGGGIVPLILNAQWQLGASYTHGSEPVTLLLPSSEGPPSVAHGLTMVRDGDDLIVNAANDSMFALWIPSAGEHPVHLGDKNIPMAASMPPPGSITTAYYAEGRLCVRTRLLPGAPLRVLGYFATK